MHENIVKFNNKLRDVLLSGGSLNDYGDLWTPDNFLNLKNAINANLKIGSDSFLKKISEQIQEAKATLPKLTDEQQQALLPLMIEVLSLYYVFPSNIYESTKVNALETLIKSDNDVAKELNLSLEQFPVSRDAINFKDSGIGSGGIGFNTNKQKEIFYLVDVFAEWYSKSSDIRESCFLHDNSHLQFQNFLDGVSGDRSPQCRHVLLHLLFPEYYEPIISSTQKWKVTRVFTDFIDKEELKKEHKDGLIQITDQRIRVISKRLATLRGKPTDFYDKELVSFWNADSAGCIPDLDTELLEYKKQVVLYGPPGTSKTYTAKKLALEIIRYRLAKDIGAQILEKPGQQKVEKALAENVHRLQLHPAYSYEDFIRGLQFQDGDTVYKPGYLLLLLDKMKKDPDLPHVLILDEINRVDLSRLFGECFSALENRGEAIDLLGAGDEGTLKLNIPDNLYIIGTMNLIDHSVEQLDFALRRRFLWVEATYSAEALFSICQHRWNDLKWDGKGFSWELVESDFERLVSAANNLNDCIKKEEELGADFVLGHVLFIEVVAFLHQFLQPYSQSLTFYLFTAKGGWRDPVEKLWKFSLNPLLKEYLSGLDQKAQTQIMKKLKEAFRP
jgi:5-methylcytosine-specific restriction protein B